MIIRSALLGLCALAGASGAHAESMFDAFRTGCLETKGEPEAVSHAMKSLGWAEATPEQQKSVGMAGKRTWMHANNGMLTLVTSYVHEAKGGPGTPSPLPGLRAATCEGFVAPVEPGLEQKLAAWVALPPRIVDQRPTYVFLDTPTGRIPVKERLSREESELLLKGGHMLAVLLVTGPKSSLMSLNVSWK